LLRRSFQADVLECSKCHGRLRALAVLNEREPVRMIPCPPRPAHRDPSARARARDPTDDAAEDQDERQLELDLP
jgi:hypothetical protein